MYANICSNSNYANVHEVLVTLMIDVTLTEYKGLGPKHSICSNARLGNIHINRYEYKYKLLGRDVFAMKLCNL